MWFYSSVEGYVYRSDVFVQKNVTEKFTEGATHDDELVAVQKRPQYRHLELVGNDVKPILVRDLSTSNIMDSRGGIYCVVNPPHRHNHPVEVRQAEGTQSLYL